MINRLNNSLRSFLNNIFAIRNVFLDKKFSNSHWKSLAYILFSFLFILICLTFKDYGITWDEIARKYYGNSVLTWYLSFYENHTAVRDVTGNMYGGFFETVAQSAACIVAYLTTDNYFETRHFINALFGLFGIIYAYKLGSLLSGRMGGFLSALFLSLTPRYYGHMFNNSKDLPFAVLFLASLYYIILSYQYWPRLPKKIIFKLGIAIGLALGIRIGGLILFGYLGLLIIGWLIIYYMLNTAKGLPLKETCVAFFSSAMVVVIAWITMLFWWPWAQTSPIHHPIKALTTASKFPWDAPVLYKGSFVRSMNLPLDYIPTWFSISLPEFYFIAILLAYFFGIYYLVNLKKTDAQLKKIVQIGMLVFAFLFPIAVVIIQHSVVYDGLRHLLFILPILTVICGISVAKFINSPCKHYYKIVVYLLIIISVSVTIADMITLHPYQTIYFNRLIAGGQKKASQNFETDYWGNSYKEGIEWLLKNYKTNKDQTIVSVCGFNRVIIRYYLDKYAFIKKEMIDLLRSSYAHRLLRSSFYEGLDKEKFVTGDVPDSDIYIALTRWNCHKKIRTGKILHIIKRKEIPLLYIIEIPKEE